MYFYRWSSQTICKYCNFSDLKTLRVTACALTEQEWSQLSEVKENYSTMIEERGLDFRFTTDLIIDIS